jgi:hypothetical protein
MDDDLKHYLDQNFARIDERFAEIDTRFDRVDARFVQIESCVCDRLMQMETNVIAAFRRSTKSREFPVNGVITMVLGFEERLALAEQRISELERRKAS